MKKVLITLAMVSAYGISSAAVFTTLAAFNASVPVASQFLNPFTGAASAASIAGSGGSPVTSYNITATGGTVYGSGAFIGANVPSDAVTITFTSGNVRAVGGNFFNTDISDAFVASPVTLTFSDGGVVTWSPTNAATFRGYTSAVVLTSVTMSAAGGTNYASLDNLRTSSVPEPGSMLALALGAVALVRRRK